MLTDNFISICSEFARNHSRVMNEHVDASKSYTYEQIDSVYYISARYNDWSERIERASYVILFKDKTALDLDGYTSVEYTKKHVLPFLEEKNIEIRSADSEKELPGYPRIFIS